MRPKRDRLILEALAKHPGWLQQSVLARLDGYPDPSTCWTWSGRKTNQGYGSATLPRVAGGATVVVHRVVWLALCGPIPEGIQLDHVCHTHSCANTNHLRLATCKQNVENASGPSSRNSSGYRGVHFDTEKGAWRARVCHYGKRLHLGLFSTAEEAGEAARMKRLELFTHNDRDALWTPEGDR